MTPVLLIGAGRLGGAMLQGWRATDAFGFDQLLIACPRSNPAVEAAVAAGARFNPPEEALPGAQTVVLAVKPQVLREVAAAYAPRLSPGAVVISVAVGVSLADLAEIFGARPVARAMPTTGVAIGRGVAALYADQAAALARAHALFDPIATTADLPREELMLQAGAVAGSGPAYLYAFVEALERAGEAAGLPQELAAALARATVTSAAALLEGSSADPADLRRQVASPGGITEAALRVLQGDQGLDRLLAEALAANMARARELAR